MQVSLIVTTYNWKEALGLVLESAMAQRVPPLEIIVGDDGSRPDTAEVVQAFGAKGTVPIRHVWQEDLGFRAAKIRNRAIAAASGDYIVMIDGDMVLHPNFIADHAAVARAGIFVQGGRLQAGPRQAQRMLREHVHTLSLFAADLRNRKNAINSKLLAGLCSFKTTRLSGIRTCNFAAWKEDVIRVNGFDEAYVGWGREDSDFALRLMKAGVRRYNLKFFANAIHLHHPENSRNNLRDNDRRLAEAIASKNYRCELGIDQYL